MKQRTSSFLLLLAIMYVIVVVQLAIVDDNLDVNSDDYAYSHEATAESTLLARDKTSGCLCRYYWTQKYITCFDSMHCKVFPRNVTFRTSSISLSTTGIKVLKQNDFAANAHLLNMRIEGNDYFERIEPGAFNNLSQLTNLSITHNKNLMYLEMNAFSGLTALEYLNLYKNGFHALKDFTYALNVIDLPKLERLVIAQMLFPRIERDDFDGLEGTTIASLSLHTCKTEYIHPESLRWFKKLRSLGLGENNLHPNNIKALLEANESELSYLSLFSIGLQELPLPLLAIIGSLNITHLTLTKNRFEIIERFPFMPHLQRLDLVDVVALNITKHAFDALPNLKLLYLNHNKFSDVPDAVLLPNLTYLDLSYSGKYFSLQDRIFANMSQLLQLNLSGNNIRQLTRHNFIGLRNLQVLGLRDATIYYIENRTFVPLENLIFLDLQSNIFPTRMLNKEIFEGLTNLQVLLLGNCQISAINATSELFIHLPNLQHLGLEHNTLKVLSSDVLQPLTALRTLDVSSNMLVSWNRRMLINNDTVRVLIASDNKLRNITKSMISDFLSVDRLDLAYNQFACTCEDMREAFEAIVELDAIFDTVYCAYPDTLTNETIGDYLNGTLVCAGTDDGISSAAIIAIPLISIVSLLALLIIVVLYAYRWHIRYWLFLTRRRCGNIASISYSNFQYDAFVSYCNEDQNFVSDLVTMLETHEPYYKLCVYERDFQIGTIITETVLDCLSKSRKTLLIVSASYVRSQWCRWEVQVAENRRLFFSECDENLVIIKLGDLSTMQLNPMLKYMMKTRIYLEWDPHKQQAFWDRLRNTLAPTT